MLQKAVISIMILKSPFWDFTFYRPPTGILICGKNDTIQKQPQHLRSTINSTNKQIPNNVSQ